MAVLVYRIHPAVGIARVGDSDQFYLAPETDALVHENPTGHSQPPASGRLYRDNTAAPGKLLRQAARFRIFEFTYASRAALDPEKVREITAQDFDIRWTVELANKKTFPATDPHSTDTNRLFTGSASKTLAGGATQIEVIERSQPGAQPSTITLATLRSDGDGRLIVVPGAGVRGHIHATDPAGRSALQQRSPGWWDDTGDGPVKAEIRAKGTTDAFKPVIGAWVILAPPAYGGPIRHIITLHDVVFSLHWIDKKLNALRRRGFTQKHFGFRSDIHPVLHRTALTSWLSNNVKAFHGPKAVADYMDAARLTLLGSTRSAAATDERRKLVDRLKVPAAVPQPTPAPTRLQMPAGSLPSVTTFQWRAFQAWVADSSFDLDWANAPATTSPLDVPAEITRAHLATAAGGHFVPGVEAGNIVTAAGTWALKAAPGMAKPGWDDAFRVDTSRIAAGDLTRQCAVPWQADLLWQCATDPTPQLPLGFSPFWPGARPLEVVSAQGVSKPFGLPQAPPQAGKILPDEAVDRWHQFGIVRKVTLPSGTVEYRDDERIAPYVP